MADSRSGAHSLHFPNFDYRARPGAVLVGKRAFKHVSDDLHVLMGVRGKAGTGVHSVFVDHAEFAETHMLSIVIISEGKTMAAIEPAGSRLTSFFRPSYSNHFISLLFASNTLKSTHVRKPALVQAYCSSSGHVL